MAATQTQLNALHFFRSLSLSLCFYLFFFFINAACVGIVCLPVVEIQQHHKSENAIKSEREKGVASAIVRSIML